MFKGTKRFLACVKINIYVHVLIDTYINKYLGNTSQQLPHFYNHIHSFKRPRRLSSKLINFGGGRINEGGRLA